MTSSKLIRRFGRAARDFTLGLTVCTAATFASLCDGVQRSGLVSGTAHARRFEEEPLPFAGHLADFMSAVPDWSSPVWSSMEQLAIGLSLSLAFASMFALNLWFARHVRRVHASQRRQRG